MEPVEVPADVPTHWRSLRIIDRASGRLVTAVEVLSPWNKRPGDGSKKYISKVERYIRAGVNVVELDLLRSRRDYLLVSSDDLPPDRREVYCALVSNSGRPDSWRVYPISLRKPLPPIPIPLRRQDGEVWLELQPLIDRAYAAGGHDDIDYDEEPDPPLSPEDAAWADTLLREAGRRTAAAASE